MRRPRARQPVRQRARWPRLAVGAGAGAVAAASVLRRRRRRGRAPAQAGPSGAEPLGRTITIQRPVEEVYAFWRDLANLPRFMPHVQRVEVLDERRSHWLAAAPWGSVEWDSHITADEPNRRIAWRSVEGARVPNSGEVTFAPAPGDRGTEVRVALTYLPPAGKAGVALARLVSEEPDQQVRDVLRRLKQLLECGEAIQVDERVSARGPFQRRVTRLLRRQLAAGGRP